MAKKEADADELAGEAHDLVELGYCIGSECLRTHGVRVATWRGIGPCSIYVVCDECHAERLTAEERKHMVEVRGAAWVRHLGIHELHNGRPRDPSLSVKGDRTDALVKAIRAITVELPDDQPNGEAERQIDNLLAAIDHIKHWTDRDEAMRRRVGRISEAGEKLCAALADDTKALREAAEAYFGGDFSKPDEPAEVG